MAEVEGPRESEGEAGESEGAAAADGFAAAIAVDEARHDPALARKVGDYLDRQARLIDLQIEHFEEDNRLATDAAKRKRFADRMRNVLEVFGILAAAVLGLGFLILLGDAYSSRSVVVDAFDAPPVLAGSGVSGKVVASEVLDQLQKLQDATRGPSKGLNSQGAWSSEIKIEAPGTGISIGEIDQLLRARFGHDVHIGGDLIQTPTGGLALTVRGDGVPAKTFDGSSDELDQLTDQAAEYIYARSQPWRYALYLQNVRRDADALAFIPGAFARATTDPDRANLANVWGISYQDLNMFGPAAEKFRMVIMLSPPYSTEWWKGRGNLLSAEAADDTVEEKSWVDAQAYLRDAAAAPTDRRPEPRFLAGPAGDTFDMPLLLRATLADAKNNSGAGASAGLAGLDVAYTYDQMHDPAQAALYVAASDPDDPQTKLSGSLLQAKAALARGDAASALPLLESYRTLGLSFPNTKPPNLTDLCYLGIAYALAGRASDAEAVFSSGGQWALCYALHGDALEHAGDVAGAQRVWAQGLTLAPDMPTIYLHRGLSELARGDLGAAQADISTANAKAPHYADPLKAWGDLLAAEHRWKDALAKYDEALKYAPAWAALRQARTAAAQHAT